MCSTFEKVKMEKSVVILKCFLRDLYQIKVACSWQSNLGGKKEGK